ncbi:hypothetical protein ACIQB4_12565 [Streptomyces griseoluteus]
MTGGVQVRQEGDRGRPEGAGSLRCPVHAVAAPLRADELSEPQA